MSPDRRKASKSVQRVTIYTRVSEARDAAARAGNGEGETSTARQLERCKREAESRWPDAAVTHHTDRGISAFSGVERPGWSKVLAEVETEQTDAVLVFAIDRAGRNIVKLMQFVETCRAHAVEFVSATQPIDTTSTYGSIMLAILAAVAEMESAIKRERALSKTAEKVADGAWVGGRRFGYALDGTLIEAEAEAIKSGASTLLNGGSLKTVSRDWNAAGLVTRDGNPWRAESVRLTFQSPTVAGLREFDGELVRGRWDAILTRTNWDAVQAIFDGRRGKGMGGARYLLTGLLTCGICGGKLVGRPTGGKRRYICTNGPQGGRVHLGIDGAALDTYVTAASSNMMLVNRESITDLASIAPELRERLAEVEALLDSQADQLAAGVPAPTVAKAARKLEAERAELVEAIETAESPWKRLAAELEREPREGEHRAALEEVIETVIVNPAASTRPKVGERANIRWREGVESTVGDWPTDEPRRRVRGRSSLEVLR